jgi:radical SAM protein with 4Fe4S-binding SPASM domain
MGLLRYNDFKNWIDQIKDKGFYVQLFFQGEPFINRHLFEMIKYAQKSKMYVAISTNGHFINEKNVNSVIENAPDKLIFSVDGLDEESYQKYRVGGSFEQADKGLRLLINRKKELKKLNPYVEFQFIVMKQNEQQIENVKKYCNEVGVDKLVFKTMQISSYENALKFLPDNSKYTRYVIENGTFRIKRKIKNHCFALWRTSVITWDGKVVPCCFDKDANYSMGVLNGKGITDIWKNNTYQDFRASLLLNRNKIKMCTNCTEGLKTNILELEQ